MAIRTKGFGALFLLLAVPAVAAEPASPSSSTTESELVRITNEQLDAANRGDMTAFGRDLADDLIYIPSEGRLFTKQQILSRNARLTNAGVVKTWGSLRDIHIIESGDSAVLTGRVAEDVIYGSQKISYELLRTAHFAKRNGRWQTVLVQLTEVPENHLHSKARPAAELRAFAGRYALAKGFIITIKLEDGKLFSRSWSGGSWDELIPVGDDVFRWRDDPADIEFVRSAGGLITHYVYRRPDGQQLIASRMAD